MTKRKEKIFVSLIQNQEGSIKSVLEEIQLVGEMCREFFDQWKKDAPKDYPIEIVATVDCTVEEAEAVLESMNLLTEFAFILSSSQTRPKPHPLLYESCINELEIKPSQILSIEADPSGIIASSLAGISSLGLSAHEMIDRERFKRSLQGKNREVLHADYIHSLKSIRDSMLQEGAKTVLVDLRDFKANYLEMFLG